MKPSDLRRAVEAARSTASALGLQVDDAVVVHNSDRIAVRLIPCDVLARVAPSTWQAASQFEVEVARRLAETDSPAGELDPRVEPRVYVRDAFAITLWTYYEPLAPSDITPADYTHALIRLHAGLRRIDLEAPHYMDRVTQAQSLVNNPAYGNEFADEDRELVSTTLRTVSAKIARRGAAEQLLHGEPHPRNVLQTKHGLLFIDLETCCRGPVEFDLAHAPEEVAAHYPDADHQLLQGCRLLVLALATAWRFQPNDQLPDGRRRAAQWLTQLRVGMEERSSAADERAEL